MKVQLKATGLLLLKIALAIASILTARTLILQDPIFTKNAFAIVWCFGIIAGYWIKCVDEIGREG